ncbi:MAG: Rpn family recombination-promoting nuclease/putative transposase [Bacilli bacterium]
MDEEEREAQDLAALRKAIKTLEQLSEDPETRRLYEERQRALRVYESEMEDAREEGMEKGREEARREVARVMLARGMDVALVSEVTGLSLEEVQGLLAH